MRAGPRLQKLKLLLNFILRQCADDLIDNLAVFDKQQRRDAHYIVFLSDGNTFVHIDLADFDFAVILRSQFLHNGGYHTAGTAPVCVKVNHYRKIRFQNFLAEIGVIKMLYHKDTPPLIILMNCTLIISLFHISVKLFIDLHFNGGRRQRTELTILHKYGNLNPLEGKVNKVQEFRRANQFALFMLAVMILGSSLVAGIMNWTGSQDMLTRYVLTYGIQFVCPLILYCAVCNERRPSDILRVRRPAWYTFFLTAVIAVAVQPALMCLSSLTSLIFHNYLTASLERYTQQPLWVTLFAAALIPAFCEEFVCRGAYLSGCRRLGIYYAAALNGIFFGVLHLNPQQGIYAAVFGFLCALIAIGADSVWPAVLAHFMINGMQIALAYLTDRFASSDQWLGAVMRETRGRADAAKATQLLIDSLKKE